MSTYLDVLSIRLDLSPADGFVRSGSCIRTVEFLASVDVYCALSTVAHQASIGDVVLDNASTKNDHARTLSPDGHGVDLADVFDDVHSELLR